MSNADQSSIDNIDNIDNIDVIKISTNAESLPMPQNHLHDMISNHDQPSAPTDHIDNHDDINDPQSHRDPSPSPAQEYLNQDLTNNSAGDCYDQLGSIKAFTEAQLLSLHPDIVPITYSCSQDHPQVNLAAMDEELYELLYELEKSLDNLAVTRDKINKFQMKFLDIKEKVWEFETKSIRKIDMCQQGRICEATFKYKQASLRTNDLNKLKAIATKLKDSVNEDYISYSFTCQIKRHQIVTKLISITETSELSDRMAQLRASITALFTFIRHLNNTDSDFVQQCRDWLTRMISKFLGTTTTEDHLFIVNQVLRGPAGISEWISPQLTCKSFDETNGFDSVPSYISHCLSVLTAILSPMKRDVNIDQKKSLILEQQTQTLKDHPIDDVNSSGKWLYIDPQFEYYGEELDMNKSNEFILSEIDIINLCQQIPVTKIFKDYTKTNLIDQYRSDEVLMLKLLAIATRILNTYQLGLSTFNSIQFNNLVEYLSLQIRHTVLIISSYWQECKKRLKEHDNALLMRLEVEYDHFILRSIITILELRRSGIWQHLINSSPEAETSSTFKPELTDKSQEYLTTSLARLFRAAGNSLSSQVTKEQVGAAIENSYSSRHAFNLKYRPANSLTYGFSVEWFHNVSDPMMWHILWQFHNNCRDKKAAFNSSCKYYNDAYWRKKFQETAVLYLFTEKFLKLPTRECKYLLNSMANMILSRSNPSSEFVTAVITEIFDVSFRCNILKTKVTSTGIDLLSTCAQTFPSLISLYVKFFVGNELPDNIVDLFDRCTLNGWVCEDYEVDILSNWLKDYGLNTNQSKVARLLLTKLLLNDQSNNSEIPPTKESKSNGLSLAFRRKICLLIAEASDRHLPPAQIFSPQSLGTSVEVDLEKIYDEQRPKTSQLDLCTSSKSDLYQQFYVWCWRIILSLRVHILDQPDTDWNSVQSRSGTSRSVMNTVLVDDRFHPVPTLQDVECLSLANGVELGKPIALFAYMMLTDVLWQKETATNILEYINIQASSGHLTASLIGLSHFMICHIEELETLIVKDNQILPYFQSVISSVIDENRISSMIYTQMLHLTQYRQLQLMRAYIKILLEVTAQMIKQTSSSWFSNDSHHLKKIACLIDNLVRFNFGTQRQQFIRIVCDSSYSVQNWKLPSFGWFNSIINSGSFMNNATRKEFITLLHVLSQKYKELIWLRWAVIESDTIRLEKIWEDIVTELSSNQEATLESAMKKKCPHLNQNMLKSILPINSWIELALDINEIDVGHPICPLVWYNFFLNYFANSLNGCSVGLKIVPENTLQQLKVRLDSLFNYHYRQWTHSGGSDLHSQLAKLYKAYMLWLQDKTLQDAYVDLEHLGNNHLVPMLKSIMQSSDSAWLPYVNLELTEKQNVAISKIWPKTYSLHDTSLSGLSLVKLAQDSKLFEESQTATSTLVIEEEADNVAALLTSNKAAVATSVKLNTENQGGDYVDDTGPLYVSSNHSNNIFEEFPDISHSRSLKTQLENQSVDDLILQIRENFDIVFGESKYYGKRITRLTILCEDLVKLLSELYANKKKEIEKIVPCSDGAGCTGPAKITLSIEEATQNELVQTKIQNTKQSFDSIIHDLLELPCNSIVSASLKIELYVKKLVDDANSIKFVIEDLLTWISEPARYEQLSGAYQPATYLLNTVLELLSNTKEMDVFNRVLLKVCFQHPNSVHIFSPRLTPSACSPACFAQLYKASELNLKRMSPLVMFVILSKFDISQWLRSATTELHKEMIRNVCSSFGQLGIRPDEEYLPSFELFRRHLQAVMSHRYPKEMCLTMSEMLDTMDKLQLAPDLWTDYLLTLGFYTSFNWPNELMSTGRRFSMVTRAISSTSSIHQQHKHIEDSDIIGMDTTLQVLVDELIRLADNQTSLEWEGLNELMGLISRHFDSIIANRPGIVLLDYYSDYVKQFIVVMASVSFMWIKSTADIYPNNHSYIWNQLIEMWQEWVFLDKSCQNIQKSDYRFVVNIFVACLQHLINKIPDNTTNILSSMWGKFRQYVLETRAIIYLELSIMQRCLTQLPWNKFLLQVVDFEYLSQLVEQESYQVNELTSHILLQVDWRESLRQLRDDPNLPQVMVQFAGAIIHMSTHLKGFKLPGQYFDSIPSQQVKNLSELILRHMEFVNLEHSQSNKLLVNLLRSMTIHFSDGSSQNNLNQHMDHIVGKADTTTESGQHQLVSSNDSFDKQLIYANFISSYLVDLITGHPSVIKSHREYIRVVVDNSLRDLSWSLLSSGVGTERKQALLGGLLSCCNDPILGDDAKMTLAESLVSASIFRQTPIVVVETIGALGTIFTNSRVLVYSMEHLIELFFSLNGHYEKLWKSLALNSVASDDFLDSCIQYNAPLALLVYFEAQIHDIKDARGEDKPKVWADFLHWASQLNSLLITSEQNDSELNESKVISFWMRVLTLIADSCPRQPDTSANHQSNNVSGSNGTSNNIIVSSCKIESDDLVSGNVIKSVMTFNKYLASIHDTFTSNNGLWSILRSPRDKLSQKCSIIALGLSCYCADKISRLLPEYHALYNEAIRDRKLYLTKMESCHKSKNYLPYQTFMDAIIESVHQSDKVKFIEGLQLISTYVKSYYKDNNIISKILIVSD